MQNIDDTPENSKSFFKVYFDLFQDKQLSPVDVLVYSYLRNLAEMSYDYKARVKIETIANTLNINRMTVIRTNKKLIDLKYITVTTGKINTYSFTIEAPKEPSLFNNIEPPSHNLLPTKSQFVTSHYIKNYIKNYTDDDDKQVSIISKQKEPVSSSSIFDCELREVYQTDKQPPPPEKCIRLLKEYLPLSPMECQLIRSMDSIDLSILGFIYKELKQSKYLQSSSLDFCIRQAQNILTGKYRQFQKEY